MHGLTALLICPRRLALAFVRLQQPAGMGSCARRRVAGGNQAAQGVPFCFG
jgi:hypothetical protein